MARSNTKANGMKRKRKPFRIRGTIVLPPDVKELDDLEFRDDLRAIKQEQVIGDALAMRRYWELTAIIEADLKRDSEERLQEALRKRAEHLIDAKLAVMQEAIEQDRADARAVFGEYVERVAKAFHLAVINEAEERAKGQAALKRIEAAMQKTRLHDERLALSRRGVIKGRRKW